MAYKETLYPMPNDPANPANREPQRPKPKTWRGSTANTASKPSQLYLWFHRNKDLKMEGKLNGIDLAEIAQAFKGTLNGWSGLIKKDPQLFRDLLACVEGKVRDLNKANLLWTELKNLKDNGNGQMETPRKE